MLYVPDKYNYDFEPKVTLTMSAKDKRKRDQKEASDNYQIVISDPTNNLQAAKEILYPKMLDIDKDEIKRITENPNPASMGGPAMPAAQPMGMPQ